jgi:hypothetical protein
MKLRILTALLLMTADTAWAGIQYPGLQVDASRTGERYTFVARFDSPLSKCAAFNFLTDYEAATLLPGVIDAHAFRESENKVKVDRTAVEEILFMHVRLHSVMEYTEKPQDGIEFNQLSGDSKYFRGSWHIESNLQGSTLTFQGQWEPDTLIPLFIIDHFAKNGLLDRFSAIAQLAQDRKTIVSARCAH